MHVGVDEAGRGPVIGPLVVAAVAVEDQRELVELGVKDSKALRPQRRERLAEVIRERYPHSLVVVEAEEIDDLRRVMTMNQLEVKLFSRALQLLLEGLVGEHYVYIDAADTMEGRFGDEVAEDLMRKLWQAPPVKSIVAEHRADSRYPVVSAASVVAKVERDRRIRELAEEIGEFGSGYPSDKRTIEFLKRYLKEHGKLPPGVRRSWRTVRRLLSSEKQSSLEGW